MINKGPELRISKFLADQGVCSRREAEHLIDRGWVFLDGEKITQQGTKINTGQSLTLADGAKKLLEKQQTVILNKPPGYVSGQPEKDYLPAIRLITPKNMWENSTKKKLNTKGMAPAGRLDIDSTGLMIFTQDGRLAKKIIGRTSDVEKEYIVRVEGKITEAKIKKLQFGLKLDGKPLKRAKVKKVKPDTLVFILKEGKKRQIRRMCESVELNVKTLKRIRIGKINLGKLPRGQWRFLKDKESL